MSRLKKYSYVLLFCFVLILSGCGTTNVLEWMKPKDVVRQDEVELARTYIDEGKYAKAKSLLQDNTDKESRILYAQCLMGLADADLAHIMQALSDDNVLDNPIFRLESLVNNADNRDKILEASDIFISYTPDKSSDKIIGALCTMTGHVANLKKAFDPTFIGFTTVSNNFALTDSVSTQYSNLGANPVRYMSGATGLILSITEEPTITEAITSMNELITTVNAQIGSNPSLQLWGAARTMFGL